MVNLIDFSQQEFQEGDNLQERFGLRGRNVMQLAQMKAPIAPGFMVDAETLASGKVKDLSLEEVQKAITKIESITGKTFSTADRPMFFKVVISPSIQIGSLRSVHTVGISDAMVEGFAKYCGEDFAYQEYQHYLEQFSQRFMGKKAADIKAIKEANKDASPKAVCKLYREKICPDFPQTGIEQLRMVITSLAGQYLSDDMNEGIEAGILVQMMVYGNYGKDSYNGSYYTRDIVTGEDRLAGWYGHNEFDTFPDTGKDISTIDPKYLKALKDFASQLEDKFLDIRQVKFTIEEGAIWIIEQNPVDGKSTQAEVRTFLDLAKKGLITKEKLIESIPPAQIQDLLHPVIDPKSTANMPRILGGIAGSPGASIGRVAFTTEALMTEYHRCSLQGLNSDLILVMAHTDAEDVQAIEVGKAVIASEGGYASHAPVVSRSLRKPCLVKAGIVFKEGYIEIEGHRVNEFDTISIEVPTYTDPTIWVGKAKMVYPDTSKNGLEEFVTQLAEFQGDFKVLGISETLNDIDTSLRLGAEGIGLFPMDYLLLAEPTRSAFTEAILLKDGDKRVKALKEVEKGLQKEISLILKKMGGKKVIFLMLDKPLTEFLPHEADKAKEFYTRISKKQGIPVEELQTRASQLKNLNPMMGLRGSRIAISYPDLYEVQFSALFRAAQDHISTGGKVDFDMMVPAVMSDAEMRFIRTGRNIEGRTIKGLRGVEQELLEEWKTDTMPFEYKLGAMIELPAAALMAGHMAKQSEFFSVGTHILTQTTNGMSHDDVNMFLPSYTQYDILRDNPFQILSTPVKQLISMAKEFGKVTRPDLTVGLCGVHASDPMNIKFAFDAKLNFITCNPYGVPIAKLAVAQHVIKDKAR
ncbi:MAG: PEP-utilizing enzyme [Deltaproteobacteria bacterium]|nr:PEP-utilizing enzyme [Deltaproteobacteria bacterium]